MSHDVEGVPGATPPDVAGGAKRRDLPRRRVRGRVVSVNVSPGGLPKRPVDGAWVGRLGLDGDGHDSPNHGGPSAAVCLYSTEAIARVAADGHVAFPGAYGENLTIEGIDLGSLAPGDVLEVGEDGLVLELTGTAAPCAKQARWFIDERIERISAKRFPADARWYARVVAEGRVEVGDRVEVGGGGDVEGRGEVGGRGERVGNRAEEPAASE